MEYYIKEELQKYKVDQPLRVYWIPQIPMEPFYQEVDSIKEGVLLLETLAKYDLFQLENNVKPDFSNAGGLQVYDENDNEWVDWIDDYGMDINELIDDLIYNQ